MDKLIYFLQNNWGDLSTIVISFVILIFALRIPHRIFKRQMFSELLKEYRSAEMGVAIKKIWDFAERCLENDKQMDEEYVNVFPADKDKLRFSDIREWQNTLHYYRRQVSQFYQQLAGLGFRFLKKHARKNLSSGDLRIIHIVFELEMHAVPETFKRLRDDQIEKILPQEPLHKREDRVHKSHSKMYELYLKSRTPKWKDHTVCGHQFLAMVSRLEKQAREKGDKKDPTDVRKQAKYYTGFQDPEP